MIVAEITLILVAGWLVAKFGEREWALLEGGTPGSLPADGVAAPPPSKSARLDAAEIYDWAVE